MIVHGLFLCSLNKVFVFVSWECLIHSIRPPIQFSHHYSMASWQLSWPLSTTTWDWPSLHKCSLSQVLKCCLFLQTLSSCLLKISSILKLRKLRLLDKYDSCTYFVLSVYLHPQQVFTFLYLHWCYCGRLDRALACNAEYGRASSVALMIDQIHVQLLPFTHAFIKGHSVACHKLSLNRLVTLCT